LVHESIYDTLVKKMADYLQQIKVGDPNKTDTQLGPLATMRQLELLENQIADALQLGAQIVTGGKRPKEFVGAYYLPTIVTHVKKTMRIWKEEVFGPVLPIVPFSTEADAIALANDTNYGLGSTIYSHDLHRARHLAQQLEAGFVDINDGNHWQPCNPFGGHKHSGMGCEHGRLGFQELCQFKVIAEA
jgi:acyl-CoA reductase-like NAD-dependent aldehyde dehydrogenase